MSNRAGLLIVAGIFLLMVGGLAYFFKLQPTSPVVQDDESQETSLAPPKELKDPLMISQMRQKSYSGSEIKIEETLAPGPNYSRQIASYTSDRLKIYGLLTIPSTPRPEKGFPAINFIHGHLDEGSYTPTARYVAYQNGFAASGYVTFKPDLRGHGNSEGDHVQSNFSPGYVTDALNSMASLQKMKEVNPDKIGMWGHSMGGGVTLRSMVVNKDIKAGVMWAGVVGDYEDLLERYRKRIPWMTTAASSTTRSKLLEVTEKYGSPSAQSEFWQGIDPYSYLKDISGPVQLHHGDQDESVPVEFSAHLEDALKKAGKPVENFVYVGSDHNIAQGFGTAMQRSIEFFDRYLK